MHEPLVPYYRYSLYAHYHPASGSWLAGLLAILAAAAFVVITVSAVSAIWRWQAVRKLLAETEKHLRDPYRL